jgi:hypothetical protein
VITLLLLGLVSLDPAVVQLIAVHGPSKALKVYFIAQGATGLVLALLWGYAAFVGKLVDASISQRERLLSTLGMGLLPVIFAFMGVTSGTRFSEAAVLMVGVVALVIAIGRRLYARKAAQP